MSMYDVKYYMDLDCVDCSEVKQTIERCGIRFVIINVTGAPQFKGRTPMVELSDGTVFEGKEAIYRWLNLR